MFVNSQERAIDLIMIELNIDRPSRSNVNLSIIKAVSVEPCINIMKI
jgi:hypothetical protein